MYVYIYIYQLKHGQLFCNPSGSVTSSRLFLQPMFKGVFTTDFHPILQLDGREDEGLGREA